MRAAIACALLALACARVQPAPVATTSGDLAVHNLSAQIDGQERILAGHPRSAQAMAALIELRSARAQFTGSVGDLRSVAKLGERIEAKDPDARVARAAARAAVHHFAAALRDLDAAGDDAAARSLRASVLQAQGQIEAALELRRGVVKEYASTRSLGALAAAEGAAGDVASALRHFSEAEAKYRDSSPFPLAWIDFQRGLLFEKHGRLDEARTAYGAAAARLPQYAQAQAHLAGLIALQGDRAKAAEILRPLSALEDPEYAGQLSALTGDRALRADAARRYEALLADLPEAFADHAARFYLAFDPRRALALAKLNLGVRRTPEAFELALSAAASTGETDCALAGDARALLDAPRSVRAMADRICPRMATAR